MQKSGKSRKVTAPVARGTTRRGGYGLSFGPAPFEETLGEGLRIHASLLTGPIGRESSSGGAVNNVFTGYSGTTSQMCSTLWSSLHYSTAGRVGYPMFENSTSYYSTITRIVGMFSKMVIRRLTVKYVPLVSTAIGGSLAIGAMFENGILSEENTLQSVGSLTKSMRTPLWKEASFVAIGDRDMNRPAMRLYDTENSTTDPYATWQVHLVGAVDGLPQVADNIGHLELETIIDVYQLKRQQPFTALESKEVKVAKPEVAVKYPVMDDDYVHCPVDAPAASQSSSSVTSVRSSATVSPNVPLLGKVSRVQ